MMFCVPPILVQLANNIIVDDYDLSSLQMLLSGAAPARSDLMEAVQKRLPNLNKIQQGYGMTEVVMVACANTLRNSYPYDSVGKLMAGFEMKVEIKLLKILCSIP